MCVSSSAISSLPHLPVHVPSSLSCIYCDESRDYDKLKEIKNLTWHSIPFDILFPVNSYFFLLKCDFASQCVSSAKKSNLPPFTQRDLKKRSQSSIGSTQPPSSPCQQGVYSVNSHTSSWAVAGRPAAMLRIKQFLSKHVFKDLYIFFTVSDFALWHPFHWLLIDSFELYSHLSGKIILHARAECGNSQELRVGP